MATPYDDVEGQRITMTLYRSIRAGDFVGRKARLLAEVTTTGGSVAARGTIVTITGKRSGLDVKVPACTACGLSFICKKLEPHLLELLPVVPGGPEQLDLKPGTGPRLVR